MQKNQHGQQQLVEQDIDEESRLKQSRKRVLTRLWEIADLDPQMTRGSMSSQVKALSMIVAIEGLIPDRRAASAQNKPAPPPVKAEIYQAAWLREQREKNSSTPAQPEAAPQPQPASELAGSPPVSEPAADLTGSTVSAGPSNPAQTLSRVPRVPGADFVAPHTRIPFIWHR
jgi:hypothetical protein